jgi:hypothetical protein
LRNKVFDLGLYGKMSTPIVRGITRNESMGDTEAIDASIPSPSLCLRVCNLGLCLLSRVKTI